jgi:hypothetical protein
MPEECPPAPSALLSLGSDVLDEPHIKGPLNKNGCHLSVGTVIHLLAMRIADLHYFLI